MHKYTKYSQSHTQQHNKKTANPFQRNFIAVSHPPLWCHQESNRGHKDFQSFALPTELWHHTTLGFLRLQRYEQFSSPPNKKCFFSFSFSFSSKMLYLCIRKTPRGIRIVAQLVAYHVRDVGVGSSSLLYPTRRECHIPILFIKVNI